MWLLMETDGYEESWIVSIYRTKIEAYKGLIEFKNKEWDRIRKDKPCFSSDKELYDWLVHHQQDRKFFLQERGLS